MTSRNSGKRVGPTQSEYGHLAESEIARTFCRMITDAYPIKVLCISPRFAPLNAADMHRLRLLLPYFNECNISVEVLCVDAADISGPRDNWLLERLPAHVEIHLVRAPSFRYIPGMRSLAFRALLPLYLKGNQLLKRGAFDLVFFSTTEFLVHVLGPIWALKWNVPFCMDFQDPWANNYYAQNPHITPPGGRLKHSVAHFLHWRAERFVVPRCGGLLAVSAAYLEQLSSRYGPIHVPQRVAPFPAEPCELRDVAEDRVASASSRTPVWRYIGRGGGDMAFAAAAFFKAWSLAQDAGFGGPIKFEALGTSYASPGRGKKTFEALAAHAGLASSVTETPDRLNYRDMLRLLVESDALVVFGSDDPAYTASKIYPYLLSRRPLLAIFHTSSSVVSLIDDVQGGICVTFDELTTCGELAQKIFERWFATGMCNTVVDLNRASFESYTARYQAVELATWFREVVATTNAA